MREIVIDTETTGLDPADGHRIVEIGCVELLNAIPTGEIYHAYIDPERDMPAAAFRVHGLSAEFLADKPVFAEVARDFLAFIDDARIIAHNAEFDIQFLNAELGRLSIEPIAGNRIVDSLSLARRKFPGAPNSLEALCARFGIDVSRRTKHGALLDAEILAEVYAELTGGRQAVLAFGLSEAANVPDGRLVIVRPNALPPRLSKRELSSHHSFVAALGVTPVWARYFDFARESAAGELANNPDDDETTASCGRFA